MSNSTLASYVQISPNCNKGRIRNGKKIAIKKITIHHMAGSLTLQQFGALVARPARQMSATYAIDKTAILAGIWMKQTVPGRPAAPTTIIRQLRWRLPTMVGPELACFQCVHCRTYQSVC